MHTYESNLINKINRVFSIDHRQKVILPNGNFSNDYPSNLEDLLVSQVKQKFDFNKEINQQIINKLEWFKSFVDENVYHVLCDYLNVLQVVQLKEGDFFIGLLVEQNGEFKCAHPLFNTIEEIEVYQEIVELEQQRMDKVNHIVTCPSIFCYEKDFFDISDIVSFFLDNENYQINADGSYVAKQPQKSSEDKNHRIKYRIILDNNQEKFNIFVKYMAFCGSPKKKGDKLDIVLRLGKDEREYTHIEMVCSKMNKKIYSHFNIEKPSNSVELGYVILRKNKFDGCEIKKDKKGKIFGKIYYKNNPYGRFVKNINLNETISNYNFLLDNPFHLGGHYFQQMVNLVENKREQLKQVFNDLRKHN